MKEKGITYELYKICTPFHLSIFRFDHLLLLFFKQGLFIERNLARRIMITLFPFHLNGYIMAFKLCSSNRSKKETDFSFALPSRKVPPE